MIRLGTSGFSYDDWVGAFYPPELPKREGLFVLSLRLRAASAWAQPGTFERMKVLGLGFCCVDEPRLEGLMPPQAQATGRVAYVRFHGRNALKWWEHDQAWGGYGYTYS